MKMQLTEQIYRTLFEEILSGKYSPGERLPTEFETAERFQASRITVRRAYAILENARIIVRKPRRGTIVNSSYTGSTEPINTIAAVMPLADDFARVFLETLCREAAKENILTVIEPDAGSGKALSDTASRLVGSGIRNMIIWAEDSFYDTELFRRLRVLGVNLVFFDRIRPADSFADYVGLDNDHAIRLLLEDAIAQKVDHIVYGGAGDLDFDTNKERRKSFVSMCKRHNITFSIMEFDGSRALSAQQQEECRKALLAGGKRAMLCVNDHIALKVLPAVPENCTVYSIDGTNEAVAQGIISVSQPMSKMAKQCLAALKRQRSKGVSWSAMEYRLKGEMIKC